MYLDITDHLSNFALLSYLENMPPKLRLLIKVFNKRAYLYL